MEAGHCCFGCLVMSVKQLVGVVDFGWILRSDKCYLSRLHLLLTPEKLTAGTSEIGSLGRCFSFFFQGEQHFQVTLVFGGVGKVSCFGGEFFVEARETEKNEKRNKSQVPWRRTDGDGDVGP